MHPPKRPGDIFFGAAVAFMFGVFVANAGWDLRLLSALALLFASLAVLFSYRGITWKHATFFFLTASGGVLYYHLYIYWHTARTRLPSGKDVAFFGTVITEPKAAGNFTMLAISLSTPYRGTVDIFTFPNSDQFNYGDEVWIKGTIAPSKDAAEAPALFLPQVRVVAKDNGSWPEEVLIAAKDHVVHEIAQELPADQASLLAAILIGAPGAMSTSLKAQMDASGTTYIINMYGYKIAIITAVLAAAFKDRLSKKMLMWITLGAIVCFVFVSGGTISAVRAAVMGLFAVVARGTGRMFSARNAVVFAALGMVIINATLLTDAAFQLSFLSFLGIYYLGPPINNYFHWTGGGVFQWKEHAMLSLATNLAIVPVVMNTFGSFSLPSFISNILIMIPWVAVIVFGALVVFFGFISPALAFCAAQITGIFLRYELFIIHTFAVLVVPMPAIFNSASAIALYYGILIVFAHYHGAPSQKDH